MDAPNRVDEWPYGLGLCCCGCGGKTRIATKTRHGRGEVRGRPQRFIHGHNASVPPVPVADRFWTKVDVGGPDDCWNWTAGAPNGYGTIGVGGTKIEGAHRVAWRLTNGDIPPGLCVCHRCDNPLCCNPAHLFLGTIAENIEDRDRKGRRCAPRGEGHWKARLTKDDVRDIRERRRSGEKLKVIAAEYDISESHVSCIARNVAWSSLEGSEAPA